MLADVLSGMSRLSTGRGVAVVAALTGDVALAARIFFGGGAQVLMLTSASPSGCLVRFFAAALIVGVVVVVGRFACCWRCLWRKAWAWVLASVWADSQRSTMEGADMVCCGCVWIS